MSEQQERQEQQDKTDFKLKELAFLKYISLHEQNIVDTYKKYYEGYNKDIFYTCVRDMRNEKNDWSCLEGLYSIYNCDLERYNMDITRAKIRNNFLKKYLLKYYYPTYTFYNKYWEKQ